jgi:hypothetical protein
MADSHDKKHEEKHGEKNEPTESEFLAQEAERAKAAMAQAWSDAKDKAIEGLDPRVWTGNHPWYALTGAALAGFVAAYSLTPTKEQQILRKIAQINRAIAGVDPDADVDAVPASETATVAGQRVKVTEASSADADHAGRKPGILGMLGRELVKAIGPSIMSSITAAVAAKTAAQQDGNGHPTPDAGQGDPEGYSNPT